MIGQYGDTKRVIADQLAQALADFPGGSPIEGQHDDAARRFAQHPQQIGDAMDDDTCLARAGAGQNQTVAVGLLGDKVLLQGVAQAFDDPPPRFLGSRAFEDFLAPGKIAADEFDLGQREIGEDEAERFRELFQAELGVFMDDVDLEVFSL